MRRSIILIGLHVVLLSIAANVGNTQERESNVLFGQDIDLVQLNDKTEITVEIYDSVTDGCWTNTSRAKALVERELLDAGYTKIVDERVWGALIAIEALGYETTQDRCAVHISYVLSVVDADYRGNGSFEWITLDYSDAATFSVLLTGPKSGMSQRVYDNIEGFTDELIVDIQQARNAFEEAIAETDATDEAKRYLTSFVE